MLRPSGHHCPGEHRCAERLTISRPLQRRNGCASSGVPLDGVGSGGLGFCQRFERETTPTKATSAIMTARTTASAVSAGEFSIGAIIPFFVST